MSKEKRIESLFHLLEGNKIKIHIRPDAEIKEIEVGIVLGVDFGKGKDETAYFVNDKT